MHGPKTETAAKKKKQFSPHFVGKTRRRQKKKTIGHILHLQSILLSFYQNESTIEVISIKFMKIITSDDLIYLIYT